MGYIPMVTYQEFCLGPIKPDVPDQRDYRFIPSYKSYPNFFSNRELCSKIKNQGREGSCTGFGACSNFELQKSLKKKAEESFAKKLIRFCLAKNRFDFSERWAYEKAKENDEIPGEDYEGSTIKGSVKALHKEGVCMERFWPYVAQDKGRPLPEASANAQANKINSYHKIIYREELDDLPKDIKPDTINLPPLSGELLNIIKKAICEFGGLNVGTFCHRGWFDVNNDGVIPYNPPMSNVGGHAICYIGYDDKRKFFEFKNSWGAKWGNNGYGFQQYADAAKNIISVWGIIL